MSSRSEAQEAIERGLVLVNGAVADKPSRLVATADAVLINWGVKRWVSRGAIKLDCAIDKFDIDCREKLSIDIGSSTGGFTEVLLERGASVVVAIDVGLNQLHERVRSNPRVHSFEKTNVKHLARMDLDRLFGIDGCSGASIIVVDVSFTSIRGVIPILPELSDSLAEWVLLVKPQFEVGHKEASRSSGVITSPPLWESSIEGAAQEIVAIGGSLRGSIVSPIKGGAGNTEFFIWATYGGSGSQTISDISKVAYSVDMGDQNK
ncbi:MAG: TlyA family RNA methyltransferase [Acidimicrobiales bacterium]|nr:TlyA family RNA methyltransferase [Acidimicrobiales bacterium]